MSRRHDRHRREARRLHDRGLRDPGPLDMSSKAVERWTGFLKTATAQGSSKPLFSDVVLGPVVVVDLEGDDPPRELRERTDAGIVRRTVGQRPS